MERKRFKFISNFQNDFRLKNRFSIHTKRKIQGNQFRIDLGERW